MSSIAIIGSARRNGNTRKVLDIVIEGHDTHVVDLLDKSVGHYDYDHVNAGDDFIGIATQLSESEMFILATPLYWYSMSAQLKTFIDRLTDLLQTHKHIGRALRGRRCAVVATGTDAIPPPSFEEPFALTCQYLGIHFHGMFYYRVRKGIDLMSDARGAAVKFSKSIYADNASLSI